MPQISLYIDETTMKKLKEAARREGASISKWVAGRLQSALHDEWPSGFEQLYGRIDDPSFCRPAQPKLENDGIREEL